MDEQCSVCGGPDHSAEWKHGPEEPSRPVFADAEALDQIAAILGLYATDPANNPVEEVLADIIGYVQNTGRRTDMPEGA